MLKEQQTSSSSFFLFPNPNPLMRSTNIPQPIIIHPPGIDDPNSFLNPKPHADDKLEPVTMAPLDVDPLAADSRIDVITNTTHLTASEHAGGRFTEPPMASNSNSNSNSPAHSETSSPQIVYAVEETKIEIKNSQIVHCDVCDVTLNSEEMFRVHKEGKKHLKKSQKLSVSSPVIQETSPPVANAASDHVSEKKKLDFVENVQSVESLFTCNIPDLVSHDQVQFTEHPHGEKQETQVTSGTLVQSSNSGTEKVEYGLNLSQKLWCEVCKVTCNGEKNLLLHNLGKKHLKNLQLSDKVGDSGEVCKAICSSRKCFRNHAKGNKYSMNLQDTEKITGLPSIHMENPRLTRGEVVNPNDGSSMRCEPCGICFASYEDLKRHRLGTKHKKAVRKTKRINGHGVVAPVAGKKLQDMMIEEGKVVFLEMGKRKANGSLASEDDDADVKRKKMMMKQGEESGASISCNVCSVTCTSVVAFMDHVAGQEHNAMVLKQVK